MNPLFKNATRAIKAALRQEMRAGKIGRILQAAERKFLRKGAATKYSRKIVQRVRQKIDPQRIVALQRGGLKELDRYARKQTEKSLAEAVYSALGPFGEIAKAFMRPGGKALTGSADREISGVVAFLRSLGWAVISPPSKREGRKAMIKSVAEAAKELGFKLVPERHTSVPLMGKRATPLQTALPGWAQRAHQQQAVKPPSHRELSTGATANRQPYVRRTVDVDLGTGKPIRVKLTDPLMTGEMIKVVSSNVYAIGFDINQHSPRIGTLKVRFWQTYGAKAHGAKVPGALYEYYNVPTEVFRRFQHAASKGKFVWDNLRIRGTISGHQFDYSLQGISHGYVPRKATITHEGEYFQQRTFLGEHARTGERRLFTSRPSALVRPFSNRPSNGRPEPPNRGTRNGKRR